MGQAYVRLGDFEKAKPLLDQVLARNPDGEDVFYYLYAEKKNKNNM